MDKSEMARKFAHDLSNKLMIVDGYVSLMLLDEQNLTKENVQKVADNLARATQVLIDFKSSDFY
jgi:predicted lactoylglutathione lyase